MDGGSRTGRDSTQAQGEEARSIMHGAGVDGCPFDISYCFSYSDKLFDKVLRHWIFVL